MKNVTASRGFTLVEALIALLVLSIGLLGVAAMQLKALQGAHMGYQRSVVSLAAIDAQERAWKYMAQSPNRFCPEHPSDATALSGIESAWEGQWLGAGKMFQDAGESTLSNDGLGVCEYEVTVNWAESRDGAGSQSFTYQFRLPDTP